MRIQVAMFAIVAAATIASLPAATALGVEGERSKGTPRDVKREMKRLDSSKPTERARGAFRLGQMGPRAVTGIGALIGLLKDDASIVMIWRTKDAGEPDFIDAGPPRKTDKDKEFIYELQVAASGMGGDAELKELSSVAQIASEALGHMGADAVPSLIDALRVGHPLVRMMAAQALGNIGDNRADQPVLDLVGDVDPAVRTAAARALGRIGYQDSPSVWLGLLGDAVPEVRTEAVKNLGTSRDPRARDALYKSLREDPDPRVRASAIGAFVETGDPRSLEVLLMALRDHEWKICNAASELLGSIKDPRSVEPLINILREDNPLARERANAALRTITGRDFGQSAESWMEWWERHRPDILKNR